MVDKITSFQGPNRFLSNFWFVKIEWLGFTYPTVEHAFQAAKFANHPEIVELIQKCDRPGDTKKIASEYKHLIEPSWFIYGRELVMFYLLQQKFHPGSDLAKQLVATGHAELIEGNTWNDTFWGVCNGQGDNHLGSMLMIIRTALAD